jgi:glutamate decarboxylase
MFLGWTYYGGQGYSLMIEHAFDMAEYLFELLEKSPGFVLVSKRPVPCLQICFYWARAGKLSSLSEENSAVTKHIVEELIPRGWMIDYAPGDQGHFFRVVVSVQTRRGTIEGLVKAIEQIASQQS